MNLIIRKPQRIKLDIGMILFVFIFLFEPPIISKVRGVIYLALYSVVMLNIRYKGAYKRIWRDSGINQFIVGLIAFFSYTCVVILLNIVLWHDVVQIGHYLRTYGRYLLLLIAVLCCVTFLICECERKEYSTEDFIKIVIYAGVIQLAFTGLAFMFPQIKELLVEVMRKGAPNQDESFYSLRAYGFSYNLVDGFGLGTGIIAGLACLLSTKKRKYFFLSIILLLVPLLNSRTGLIVFFIAILLYILMLIKEKNIGRILELLCLGVICVLMVVFFWQYLITVNPEITKWVLNGLEGFWSALSGKEISGGSMQVLMQDSWWELPEGIRSIIGTGHSRYEADGYGHTDVGYVNDVWFCGIIGSILLYWNIFSIFYKGYQMIKERLLKVVILFLGLSIIVFNAKTCAFSYYPGTAIIFSVLFLSIYNEKRKSRSEISKVEIKE